MEEEIKKLFLEIVSFGKEVSPEIWGILIKQQIIAGWATVVGTTLCFLLFLCFGLMSFKATGGQNEAILGIALGGFAIFGIFFIIFVFFTVGTGIPRILNPEYYALMDLKP